MGQGAGLLGTVVRAPAIAVAALAGCAGCADPEPPPPAPPDAGPVTGDFAARCAGPGVVRCMGFDTDATIAGRVLDAWDNMPHASIDPDVAATGAGSLRFDLPTRSGPSAAGAVWLDVTDDLSVQFGAGERFYVQWRQRFSPEMLRAFAVTGPPAGWHQLGIGEGDQSGQLPITSCTELELVVEQDPTTLAPAGHHDCLREAALVPTATVPHRAGEWMTFQLGVEIGTWNTPSSRVQLWVARAGEPQALVLDATDFRLDNNPGTNNGTNPGARYGKLWFEPFVEGKDPTEDHPTATTWYDDLIVARQWIGDAVP